MTEVTRRERKEPFSGLHPSGERAFDILRGSAGHKLLAELCPDGIWVLGCPRAVWSHSLVFAIAHCSFIWGWIGLRFAMDTS